MIITNETIEHLNHQDVEEYLRGLVRQEVIPTQDDDSIQQTVDHIMRKADEKPKEKRTRTISQEMKAFLAEFTDG